MHLWSEIGCRYYSDVPETEPRLEVSDWVIVFVLVRTVYLWLLVFLSCKLCITVYGAAVQRHLEHFDAISPDTSVWLFFGWMIPPLPFSRTHDAPVVQQALLLSLSPLIDLDDAVQDLLESDDS